MTQLLLAALIQSTLLGSGLLGASPTEATPPAELREWVRYAQQLKLQDPGCPPGHECIQNHSLQISGNIEEGEITLRFSGANLGVRKIQNRFFGPSSTFAVINTSFKKGKGVVKLTGDYWSAEIEKGDFIFETKISFEPQSSLPLELLADISAISENVNGGHIAFDESSNRHTGIVFLQSGKAEKHKEEISIRTNRAFSFASVPTFVYHYRVSGLSEQARIILPLLEGEVIESLSPSIPYTLQDGNIALRLTPGRPEIKVRGHFKNPVTELVKKSDAPFEMWLFDADPRHPVTLQTDAVEIDPAEVEGLSPKSRSRAFFMSENQKLEIHKLDVHVDEGRQGAGKANMHIVMGHQNFAIGELKIHTTSAPKTDRLRIPTPHPPHYMSMDQKAERMFEDEGDLSVRLVSEDQSLGDVRTQWREELSLNPVFSTLDIKMPAQNIHLEDTDVRVDFVPGFVPVYTIGAQNASGDLADGLHIYALLLALLGVALGRAAQLKNIVLGITFILLAGLYTVSDFPKGALLSLLVVAAITASLPASVLQNLATRHKTHALLKLIWLTVLVMTIIPSSVYIRDRILIALHPWATQELSKTYATQNYEDTNTGYFGMAGGAPMEAAVEGDYEEYAQQLDEMDKKPSPKKRSRKLMKKGLSQTQGTLIGLGSLGTGNNNALQGLVQQQALRQKAHERTVRPVAFGSNTLSHTQLRFSFGALLPGADSSAHVLVAGPWLRALWLFAESIALVILLLLLAVKTRRFFLVPAVVTTGEVEK